ncbi:MAG TPA: SWIM zinc finger family protein [Pyrinomonadaceae bacterium]|nr:SWIM zinc finger family protein [Pyrinomonadaceae bacterium]
MIQLTTADKLQKAISKARTVKPLVRINTFGSYTVINKQTGATYTVECSKRDGRRFAACSCKAGERGQACYHVAAAASAHIQLAAERAAVNC